MYQIGNLDTSGREIEQIAYYEPGTYMIYFVKEDYLKAYYVDAYEFKDYFQERFEKLMGEIRSMNIKNDKSKIFVRQSMASAYYNALNGYSEVAIGELVSLKNKLVYASYTKWLTAYLTCNLVLIAVCMSLLVVNHHPTLVKLSYCIVSSCVGSFLVYAKKENDHATEHYLPIMDAIITFFASSVSGFLVYCILQSNLLFGAFNESIYGMMIICFIAGYNEDMPLKLLKSLTGMADTAKNKHP